MQVLGALVFCEEVPPLAMLYLRMMLEFITTDWFWGFEELEA